MATSNTVTGKPRQSAINKLSTATSRAKLGDVVADLVKQLNTLTTKYNALLAKMDTANVTGLSNNNAAQCGAPATPIVDMESR
jgi:hypothetical protein